MKLATFSHAGATRIGVVVGDEAVIDLAAAAPDAAARHDRAARGRGPRARRRRGTRASTDGARIPLAALRLARRSCARPSSWRSASTTPITSPRPGPPATRPRGLPDLLQQAVHLRDRARRGDPPAARLASPRLRGRARVRDRAPLPARAARARRTRSSPGYHDLQRRVGPRLAAPHADDDDGQVLRHATARSDRGW